jgi:hypothetical protein
MNITTLEEKLKALEENAKENLQLVRDIRAMLLEEQGSSIAFNELDFNLPGLLKGLSEANNAESIN